MFGVSPVSVLFIDPVPRPCSTFVDTLSRFDEERPHANHVLVLFPFASHEPLSTALVSLTLVALDEPIIGLCNIIDPPPPDPPPLPPPDPPPL